MSSTHPNRRSAAPGFGLRPLSAVIRHSLLASAGAVLAQGAWLQAAVAAPQSSNVVAGQGAISAPDAATTLVHQQSHSMVVNWQSFDVARPETVQFNQPSSSAAVLNRVLNQSASQIHGAVRANGQVFILNSSGVVIGNDARVDVGGLVVSSLDISNSDFMQGRYSFKAADGQTPGAIVNRGLIQAARGGSVTLVGGQVANEGVIVADAGHVNLAAGRTATVDFDGDGLLRFEVDGQVLENATGADAAVSNSGEIRAEGGRVLLSARAASQVFDRAVNNSGLIRAGGIQKSGGKVTLTGFGGGVKNTGTVDASGSSGGEVRVVSDSVIEQYGNVRADGSEGNGGLVHLASLDTTLVGGDGVTSARSTAGKGGSVRVLGGRVALLDTSRIDVSGATGGGEALIGGDLRGANPDVANAKRTYVAEGASINADAHDSGDGGKIVVWADEITRFFGNASARGGAAGGDGGVAEVSGKQTLTYLGLVDLSAPAGARGTLLLDPNEINITAATGTNNADLDAPGDATIAFADDDGDDIHDITAAHLVMQLDLADITLQANSQIDVEVAVDASGNANSHSLELDAPIINFSDGANITLNNANLILGYTLAGNVVLADGATVVLSTGAGAGNISITGSLDGTADGGAETLSFSAGTGTVTVTGQTGNTAPLALTLGESGGTNFQNTVAATTIQNNDITGTVDFDNTVTAATFNAAVSTTTNLDNTLTVTDGGAVAGALEGPGGLTKQGAGTLTLSGANTYTGVTSVNAGVLLASNATSLGTTGMGTTVAAGATLEIDNLNIGAEAIALAGGLDGTGANARAEGVITLSAGSDFGGTGTLRLTGQVTGVGPLVKNDAGTLVLSSTANDYSGATGVNAGTLRLGASEVITNASAVTVAGGAVFDLAGNSESVGSLAGAGNTTLGAATLTAGGNGTSTAYSGVLSGPGGLTKQGAGTLTLSGANTYTGVTSVNAGVLLASNATSLGTTGMGTTVAAGATLEIDNVNIGAEAVTLSGTLKGTGTASLAGGVTLANAAAVFNAAAGSDSLLLSGVVSDGGGTVVTKTGAGTLTLSGANTYTGLTAVDAGTLVASDNAALGGAGAGTTVAAGATLSLNNVNVGTEAITLAGSLDGAGAQAGGPIVLTAGSDFGGAGTLTLTGRITGTGPLVKSDAGTLVLANPNAGTLNNYTGATIINAGTLQLNRVNQITDASAVTVAGGATFNLNGNNEIIGSLAGAGAVTLGAAALAAGGDGTSTTYSGVMSGVGGLVKQGGGTLSLSGASTYTGPSLINAGTLSVTSNTALGAPMAGTTVNGATLDINGLTLGAGQFAEMLTFNGGKLTGTAAVLGAGAADLLTLGAAGATLTGTFSLGADFALVAGGPLTIISPIIANGLAFSVSGAPTNLGASIGDAATIAFGPLNVTAASTLTTNALNLNGAVSGGGDLTILRASASAADTTIGGTDPLISAASVARFSAGFTGVLSIGGTRDTPPSAAQLLNNIEITHALTTGGDVFLVGAGDIRFSGDGRINSPGNTVSLVALGAAAVPDSGNIRDDNSLPTGAAPNFVTAGTIELLAANQIGSESNSEGGTLNFHAATVSAAQVVEGDAQVDNGNRSAGDSDSVLVIQEVYALVATSGAALGGLFNDAFRDIGSVASLSVTTISTPKQAKGELGFIDEGVFLLPSAFTSPERAMLMPLLGDADFPGDQRPQDPDDEAAWLAFFEDVLRPYIVSRYPLGENATAEERAAVEAIITAEMNLVIAYYELVRERERTQLALEEAAREAAPPVPAQPGQDPELEQVPPLQQGGVLPTRDLGHVGQSWSHGGIGVEARGWTPRGAAWPVSIVPAPG